jgi:MFS family permease
MSATRFGDHMSERRKKMVLLGVPTFGLALAVTAVSTYLPVVARERTASTIAIGGILAIEGLMALWLPLVVGSWSDRLRTPVGGRVPFLVAGAPTMLAPLCLMGIVRPVAVLAGLVFIFFFGYFVAYEPYRALYPDLIADDDAGRSQSVQAGWRGAGTGIALVSGGALLSVAAFLPFVVFGIALALSVALFVALLLRGDYRDRVAADPHAGGTGLVDSFVAIWQLVRDETGLRSYLVANGLWEAALAAIKTFVVLYVTVGLGYSLVASSLIIGGVAVIVLGAALLSGSLADRHGRLRVTEASVWIFGTGLLVVGLTTSRIALIVSAPLIAIGGGTLMSLPYSLLMPLMPEGGHGAITGLNSVSRGIGVMAGPLLAGLAIQSSGGIFASTEGYAAAWWIAGGAALLSIIPLRRLRAVKRSAEKQPSAAPPEAWGGT